ncbi:hypothetical protein CHI02_14175 [Niallia circulans]|nr:hypothetical protein CHI02_14175 [Niallia circulans]
MEIEWKKETIIFETLRESEVWADSIANEIHGRTINGYITPDYKIAYALSFFLASNPDYVVHTEKSFNIRPGLKVEDSFIYKVWVTFNSK